MRTCAGLKNAAARMQWNLAVENSETVVRMAEFIYSESNRLFAHIQTDQGKEDKDKYDSAPDYKLIQHLTVDHILWGLGIASSRDFKSSASEEAVEGGAPSLITSGKGCAVRTAAIAQERVVSNLLGVLLKFVLFCLVFPCRLPYADMPNHASNSQTFMNIKIKNGEDKDDGDGDGDGDGEGGGKEVADSKYSKEECLEASQNVSSTPTGDVYFILEVRAESLTE